MSGQKNEHEDTENLTGSLDSCDIISIVSAFLTSERDFRLVIPDFFEMLLKNLLCHSIYLFVSHEKGDDFTLHLEFAESLYDIEMPDYLLNNNQGLTGKIANSRSGRLLKNVTVNDLDGEEKFNPFLEGRTLFVVPLIGRDTVIGVLEFVFDSELELPPADLIFTISNIFTNYLSLLLLRRESARVNKKFTYLNRIGKAFSVTLELRSILSVVMNLTSDALSAEVGVFVLFSEDGRTPQLEINWGIALNDLRQISDADGKSLMQYILDSEESICLRSLKEAGFDVSTDAERRLTIDSLLAGSLKTEQMPAGIFLFANKRSSSFEDRQAVFEQEDEILFSIMLDQVKNFVDNYFLYKQIVSVKNFNDNILKSIKSGVITVDLDGNILFSNRMACEISGVEKDLVGHHIQIVFPLPIFEKDEFASAMSRGAFPERGAEYEFNRNGQDAILSFVLSPLRDDIDTLFGAVITVHDMTEKRIMEKRIRRAEHLAALGELSAGLAHEIKNPLTSIKGFAQLLPQRLGDQEFLVKFSKMITTELMRLNTLTERLLTYAQPSVGDFKLVSLVEILEETVSLVEYQFEKRNVTTKMDFEKNLPFAFVNPDRISQVFLNIIINALHAMDNGGILCLSMSEQIYDFPVSGRNTSIITEFVDNGEGIKKEYLEKLFNPFFTTKERGTGLGLAISYRIIEEHGGLIEVHSTEHKGTTMRVVLPVERLDAQVISN